MEIENLQTKAEIILTVIKFAVKFVFFAFFIFSKNFVAKDKRSHHQNSTGCAVSVTPCHRPLWLSLRGFIIDLGAQAIKIDVGPSQLRHQESHTGTI